MAQERRPFSFIVDIGTTTVKYALWSTADEAAGQAEKGAAVAFIEESEKNAQSIYGTDVVSRVLCAHHNGVSRLQNAILRQIWLALLDLTAREGLSPDDMQCAVITGNTVMLHLLQGLSVQGFEKAPFTPVTVAGRATTFGDLFAPVLAGPVTYAAVPVYLPPCINAFVGADAVCAALHALQVLNGPGQQAATAAHKASCDARSLSGPLLVCDIGTNTEVLLIKDGRAGKDMLCCSSAAGPAFENGVFSGKISGSGLVHALAVMRASGILDETGLLSSPLPGGPCNRPESGPNVAAATDMVVRTFLSHPDAQQAVRTLQLAKGAVAAAIDTLLHEAGLVPCQIGSFFLCGNFGSALSATEAERIGLIPAGLAPVTVYAGNAAILGASLLADEKMRRTADNIAASGTLIQLADSSFFATRYIERMNF